MNPSKKKIAGTLKTLSIGGATYDLFVQIGNDIIDVDTKKKILTLPIGAKIRVQDIVETCGGGACNTSVGLSRLGLAASFCGIVGSDQWGQRMLDNLQKEHVHTESATILEHETSSFSVILNVTSGDRIILYSTGTNAHLHDVTFDREAAAKHDWIYFNHIHEKSCVIQDDILHILQKHHAGMTWNPGGRQLKAGIDDPMNAALLKQCDLLLLNKEEAYAFTKKTTVNGAIHSLLKAGVGIVCVSDGANGCTASDGRNYYVCPVVSGAPIVDTTGAGDAFGVGATWALLEGFNLPNMLKAGTLNATSVLGSTGAQAGLLTNIEIRKKLEECRLDVAVRSL